jgi:HSP20 family molecular chaperone IbpA
MKMTSLVKHYRPARRRRFLPEPREDSASREWPLFEDGSWIPRLNIYSKEGKFHIDAELPGVEKRDISVHLCGKTLTITGRRALRREPDYLVDEIPLGVFHRIVNMPESVNPDSARLALESGILSIVLESDVNGRIMNE